MSVAACHPWSLAHAAPPDDLLAALRRRDPQALDALSARWGRRLMRVAWTTLGDAAAADDAVQETLIAAWDAGPRLAADADLRAWLFAVLMNQCRKQQRGFARWWRRIVPADPPAPEPGASSALPTTTALHAAIAALPEPLRATVVLRYLEELPVADVARILAVPPGTVKSRCHHALERLRGVLQEASDA